MAGMINVAELAKARAAALAPALMTHHRTGFAIKRLRWVEPTFWLDGETPVRFEGVGS